MKKINNKAKAIYLSYVLIHLVLLFSPKANGKIFNWGGRVFYPFTKGETDYPYDGTNWNAQAYDLTEFVFYLIAPVIIYYIVTLFNSRNETDV